MKPTTPVEHRMVSDAINDHLSRVNEVYHRIAGTRFDLHVLGLVHYVLHAVPNAEFIDLSVTDQGGDTMTFDAIGVSREKYDQWTDDRSYSAVQDSNLPVDLVTVNDVEYVLMDVTYDVFSSYDSEGKQIFLNEDAIVDYAMALEDYELESRSTVLPGGFWEQSGLRNSGMGRLWIAPALLSLGNTYEGFVGEALDPFPDPNDQQAVAAWLARETAPVPDEEPLCGCGARHAVHTDEDEDDAS